MPTLTQARLKELEDTEKRYKAEKRLQEIRWVGEGLGKYYATVLASTPWSKWTESERSVLRAVCGSASTAKALYLESLPKD